MSDDRADAHLIAFLSATTDSDADLHLARILDEVARPTIRKIVGSVLSRVAGEDIDDVVSDTIAHLLQRLRDLRSDRSQAIHDLRRYIVTCAYNRCHERLRERYPVRSRLRNHLRYVLGHHPKFALWRTLDSPLICGLRSWSGGMPRPASCAEQLTLTAASDPLAEDHEQIVELMFAAFRNLGGPIDFDALVDLIGRSIQIERRSLLLSVDPAALTNAPAAEADLDLRFSLRDLWTDICQLSPNQRVALLLTLRDADGREVLSLLAHTRTATIDEIAGAIRITPERLVSLWRELPLSDAAIGEQLGATAQQVVKIRRLARERLRRMSQRRDHVRQPVTIGGGRSR